WRKLPEGLKELADIGLGREQKEDMLDPPMGIVDGLMVRALEGIAQQIEELGESQGHEGILPDIEAMGPLFGENELPAPVAQGDELPVVAEVEEFLAGRFRRLPGEVGEEVVSVEVDLEGLVADLVAGEQLLLDIRLPGGGQKGRQPVFLGNDHI